MTFFLFYFSAFFCRVLWLFGGRGLCTPYRSLETSVPASRNDGLLGGSGDTQTSYRKSFPLRGRPYGLKIYREVCFRPLRRCCASIVFWSKNNGGVPMDQLHADAIRRAIEAASTHAHSRTADYVVRLLCCECGVPLAAFETRNRLAFCSACRLILFPHGIDWRLASR